jgi:predicted RNase H-like nuclease (RuvC/YqgF family)
VDIWLGESVEKRCTNDWNDLEEKKQKEEQKMDETIVTVVASIIGTLGSAKAWEYYSTRAALKKEERLAQQQDNNLYRDDLRKEVERLRLEIKKAYADKEAETVELRNEIRKLSEELAEMRVRVEFLEKENNNLRGVTD